MSEKYHLVVELIRFNHADKLLVFHVFGTCYSLVTLIQA